MGTSNSVQGVYCISFSGTVIDLGLFLSLPFLMVRLNEHDLRDARLFYTGKCSPYASAQVPDLSRNNRASCPSPFPKQQSQAEKGVLATIVVESFSFAKLVSPIWSNQD